MREPDLDNPVPAERRLGDLVHLRPLLAGPRTLEPAIRSMTKQEARLWMKDYLRAAVKFISRKDVLSAERIP